MLLDRPIFIVGTGRCGSTLLHEMLIRHPRLAYLSRFAATYPHKPHYNHWAMRAIDLPLVGGFLHERFWPSEAWEFWDQLARGFRNPCRDLHADDLLPPAKKRIAEGLAQMTTTSRDRLLVKLTGWARLGYVGEIFPDARFIHVVRDGRSVVSSTLNVDFWDGWRGPSSWRMGALNAAQQAEWDASGHSFVVLAAIQWKILMDAFDASRAVVPAAQMLEIRYEDLMADPQVALARILEFCGLENPPGYQAFVRGVPMRDSNSKWRSGLTPAQQQALQNSLAGHLARWGYDAG